MTKLNQQFLNAEITKSSLAIELRKQVLAAEANQALIGLNAEIASRIKLINLDKGISEEDKRKQTLALQDQIEANNRIINQYETLLPKQQQFTEQLFKASQIKMLETGRTRVKF